MSSTLSHRCSEVGLQFKFLLVNVYAFIYCKQIRVSVDVNCIIQ